MTDSQLLDISITSFKGGFGTFCMLAKSSKCPRSGESMQAGLRGLGVFLMIRNLCYNDLDS